MWKKGKAARGILKTDPNCIFFENVARERGGNERNGYLHPPVKRIEATAKIEQRPLVGITSKVRTGAQNACATMKKKRKILGALQPERTSIRYQNYKIRLPSVNFATATKPGRNIWRWSECVDGGKKTK